MRNVVIITNVEEEIVIMELVKELVNAMKIHYIIVIHEENV